MNVVRPRRWKSWLGPQICPYENPFFFARWFFYKRLRRSLEIASPQPEERALEFGCWEGYFLPSLLANYAQVCAVENDSASLVENIPGKWTILQSARELCAAESAALAHLQLVKADGERLPLRSESFDAVFCLDSLAYVRQESRLAVLSELCRVLKPTGTAVFTLPIELGPTLLVRQLLRWASGVRLDDYSWRKLIRAVFFFPEGRRPSSGPSNLIGYDYRQDQELIASNFDVRITTFLPWDSLRLISPTVLLACKKIVSTAIHPGTKNPSAAHTHPLPL